MGFSFGHRNHLYKLAQAPGKSAAVVHSGKRVAILGSEDGSDCLAFNKEATNTGPSFDDELSILRRYNHVFET